MPLFATTDASGTTISLPDHLTSIDNVAYAGLEDSGLQRSRRRRWQCQWRAHPQHRDHSKGPLFLAFSLLIMRTLVLVLPDPLLNRAPTPPLLANIPVVPIVPVEFFSHPQALSWFRLFVCTCCCE